MSRSLHSGLTCSGKSQKKLARFLPVFGVIWLAMGAHPAYGNAAGDEIGPALQQSIIWIEEKPVLKQVYCVFRREFNLTGQPAGAKLHLFADARYILWVNGAYVDRGPCRFDPRYPEYDTLDIQKYLQPGPNAIAVLVHNYSGAVNGRMMNHVPGFTARLDMKDNTGQLITIPTDEAWRANDKTRFGLSPEISDLLPGKHMWSSIADNIDARRDRRDWMRPGFDDTQWTQPYKIDGSLWGELKPRSIPLLREQEVKSLQIIEHKTKTETTQPLHLPISLQSGETLIIDAGEFTQAYSALDFEAEEGSQLELNYAQTYYSSGSQPVSNWNMPNRYIARAGRQEYRSGDTFGFKYLVIEVRSGSIQLQDVKIINRLYPFDLVGQFTCNDEMLNTLWQNSMRTVLLCSEDAYVDCATRERVEWLGDGVSDEYPITRVAFAGPGADGKPWYGDPRLIRNMLRHIGQSSQPDGRVRANYPSDYWDIHSYIEDYACLWMQGIRTYYDATGDLELAQKLWPAITGQLKWFLDRKTPNGLVNAREFVFPGNPLVYQVCEGITLNAAIYKAFNDMAAMVKLLGQSDQHGQYAAEAAALSKAVNEHLWDEPSGSYYGAIQDGQKIPPTAHGAVMALYFGIVPEDRRERVNQWLLANYTREDFSPYVHRYLFEVFYQMNNSEVDQLVLDLIRQRWVAMVNYETKTVWEGFGPGEACHNMASPPAYFLSAYVLGVRVELPVAQKRIVIEPRLGNLVFAQGIVVTEFGPVPISWRREKAGLSFHYEIPSGVTADISIPRLSENPTLTINNKIIVENGKTKDSSIHMDSRHIRFQSESGNFTGEQK